MKDDGIISLLVPDKRYCFDHYRQISRISKIIDAHLRESKIHSPGTVAEYFLNVVSKAGVIAWDSGITGEHDLIHTLDDATQGMKAVLNEMAYLDVHAWCFVPHSFSLMIQDLYSLGFIPFQEVGLFPRKDVNFIWRWAEMKEESICHY